MKKKKELLLGVIVILIGIGCILLMCERAEQVNNMEVSYEKSY